MDNQIKPFLDEHDKIKPHHHNYLFPEFFRFTPWYDDRADYHTNAKSYYDYLSRYNKVLSEIVDLLNRVAERNLTTEDTKTIELIKNGDWIDNKDSVIKLLANVKLSKQDKNHLEIKEDGLYSKSYDDEIKAIQDDIKAKYNEIITKANELDKSIKQNHNDIVEHVKGANDNFSKLNDRLNKLETDYKAIPKIEGVRTTTQYNVEIAGSGENPDNNLFNNTKKITIPAILSDYKYIEFFYHEGSTFGSARFPSNFKGEFGITVTNILDASGKPFLVRETHIKPTIKDTNTDLEITFISYLNQNGDPVNIFSKANPSINFKENEATPPLIYKIDLIKEVVHE